ncbi:STAS domain-containing protein [Candidatus Enterovibrio escicola]|uniref:STAS domain-containing protein n=1 Tax=Candidatus Enterovibrio escicola TaxID=1927127 RepID=UPI001CC24927|nr:STAS domain-containing protein [Candidatus Enterovibrio escacola]
MNEPLVWRMVTNGYYCLSGRLDRGTVPVFWGYRADWLPADRVIILDLSDVKHVDSSGMSMLLHLWQQLRVNKQMLTLIHVPSKLNLLLRLSNVESLFMDDQTLCDGK